MPNNKFNDPRGTLYSIGSDRVKQLALATVIANMIPLYSAAGGNGPKHVFRRSLPKVRNILYTVNTISPISINDLEHITCDIFMYRYKTAYPNYGTVENDPKHWTDVVYGAHLYMSKRDQELLIEQNTKTPVKFNSICREVLKSLEALDVC